VIFSPPNPIYRHSGWMIDSDVSYGSRLIVSSILTFGAAGVRGYFGAITVLRDSEQASGLQVTSNYYVVP
jgi:hypothetical protein